jgi:3-oxoacyl-[acyl-carrier-protein] synthase-3
MQAVIKAIEYHLPERSLTNSQLIDEFPEWTTEKIEQKTGIAERRIAAQDECSSDLGVTAAQKLFSSGACRPDEIDYILLCTQTPDYFLPTTACIMQERLDIPTTAGALDFNLGCSGYVYGLGLAKGLIETGQARNVLLITAETYSKLLSPDDKSVRAIFGDAAAATLITGSELENSQSGEWIGPFVFGTDGGGAQNLIVPAGGMRQRHASSEKSDDDENRNPDDCLYMNGPEIFTFTLRVVPKTVEKLLSQARKRLEDIDLFVFHQANKYMLDYLQKKLKIPEEKFYIAMRHCGNTVCSTIPIALKHALEENRLQPGQQAMLVGFGVGYSWGGTLIRWA